MNDKGAGGIEFPLIRFALCCICWDQNRHKGITFKCLRVRLTTAESPHLVGSASWVEGIRSADKQGVIILLQENLDEIVALILQESTAGRERQKKFRKAGSS